MRQLLVKAPAKINLTLDVKHKREDGYHEVEMIMTTIDLADRIELTARADGRITVDSSAGYVPNDERNLAYQAAALLKSRFNISEGVHIYLDKQIPVAAGLGGGSSDAAATLRGLNQLWNLGLTRDELAQLGAELGSDVPFLVYGGTAVATGRGEIIRPISPPPSCWVVLAKPPIGVSTAEVYERLRVDEIASHPDNRAMEAAIREQDFDRMVSLLGNVLEPVTFSMYPEVKRLRDLMVKFGGEGVLMSGSGPVVYALMRGESKARRMVNGLRGFCKHVYMVRLLGKEGYPLLKTGN